MSLPHVSHESYAVTVDKRSLPFLPERGPGSSLRGAIKAVEPLRGAEGGRREGGPRPRDGRDGEPAPGVKGLCAFTSGTAPTARCTTHFGHSLSAPDVPGAQSANLIEVRSRSSTRTVLQFWSAFCLRGVPIGHPEVTSHETRTTLADTGTTGTSASECLW